MIRKVYVIHHSHTDIGYTHGQSRIVRWHAAYIRQAMEIAARRADFAWTCETFHPVEEFWKHATSTERENFISLTNSGKIGITAGFLHFTELADAPLLEALARRAERFAADTGTKMDSAMLADINGCPLIHARALARAGVKFLVTCVHPHHGYVPLGKRQELFRWDLGDGLDLMVAHLDHYHTGNDLGLAPGAEHNYLAGFSDPPGRFDEQMLERRLPDYLRRMELAGWKHEFCAIAVSGLITDNGPPAEAIADRMDRWNQRHGSEIHIEMTTPSRLHALLADSKVQLPTHAGDWPDWWSDGVAGDPEAVALFRSAQRDRRWLVSLGNAYPRANVDLHELDQSLALFTEHTFGHSASVSAPWNLLAQQLRLKKLGFAGDAADRAEALIDEAVEHLGGGALAYNRPPAFRVINPFDHPVRDLVELEIEGCETFRWKLATGEVRVVNQATRQVLPHQAASSMRGRKVVVDIALAARESVELIIEPVTAAEPEDIRILVPDRARDLADNAADVPPVRLKTAHVNIEWTAHTGITCWRDGTSGRNLIDANSEFTPFTLRTSRLPATLEGGAQCIARRKLGRNRNGPEARWSSSKLTRVVSGSTGEHFDAATLEYAMDGCELIQLRLEARHHEPRVDVELIMHKQGTWDAENVYLALPFTTGSPAQLYLDRGVPIRPGIDQLPGTLCDYYALQDGLAWCGDDFGLAIAQKDSHLIQTGPLGYGVRQMSGEKTPVRPNDLFAWLMTNYWETNFSPELGGFYSFRFSILWGESLRDPAAGLRSCRDATTGLRAIRMAR